jgi:hypothetical protein
MTSLLISLALTLSAGVTNESVPNIGAIDFYGVRTVPKDRLRQALQIKEGDPATTGKEESVRRLEEVPKVSRAGLTFVCCDAGKTTLYVGIQEEDSPAVEFRPAPQGSAQLPADILRDGAAITEALSNAVIKGDAAEDHLQGHALSVNPEVRAIQQRFVEYASRDLDSMRTVLRTSPDPSHRALAAEVIGYAPRKRQVVSALLRGMKDPAPKVRNNCMRALVVIAEFARRSPREHIQVPSAPFVDLLHSLEWSDRNKAAAALRALTETRDSEILAVLAQRGKEPLEEMARWKSPSHAYDAFVLLGRANRLSETEIRERWHDEPDKRRF